SRRPPLKDYAWGTGYSVSDCEVKIWIGKDDRTFDRMSKELIARLSVPDPLAIGLPAEAADRRLGG
ncbi:hypothetical protein QBC38DRAFT_462564, partial [Podospora fimiseda]